MNIKNNKGFTLIELLVVIAIIGILSGIIIVNIGDQSSKAKDVRIKSDLDNIRTTMEIAKMDSATLAYPTGSDVTGEDGIIKDLLEDINKQKEQTVTQYYATDAWCVQASLNVSGSWCVDSTGYAGSTANCDTDTRDCVAD